MADLLVLVDAVKVTVSMHVPPAATGLSQPETEKSAASVPVIFRLLIVSGPAPEFVIVRFPVTLVP